MILQIDIAFQGKLSCIQIQVVVHPCVSIFAAVDHTAYKWLKYHSCRIIIVFLAILLVLCTIPCQHNITTEQLPQPLLTVFSLTWWAEFWGQVTGSAGCESPWGTVAGGEFKWGSTPVLRQVKGGWKPPTEQKSTGIQKKKKMCGKKNTKEAKEVIWQNVLSLLFGQILNERRSGSQQDYWISTFGHWHKT